MNINLYLTNVIMFYRISKDISSYNNWSISPTSRRNYKHHFIWSTSNVFVKISLSLVMKTVYFYFRRNDNFLLLQAMKVENVVWLKEEFDYKSLCRKLETNLDKLIAENERQSQAVIDAEEEMQMKIKDAQKSVMESEKKLATTLEVDITVHLHNVHVNLS